MLFLQAPLRLVTFALLALLVGRRWETLADPRLDHALRRATALAIAVGAVLLLAGRLRGRLRGRLAVAAGAVLGVAILAAALVAAGIPVALLAPRRWDDLVSGVGTGISALPDLRVPYRGEQQWIRTTIALGGTLLLVLAAVACFLGPGRPTAATAILLGAYVVAVTQVEQRHAIGDGALLTLLLVFLLLGERVRLDQATAAGATLLAALAVGTIAVHRLDSARPWIDYRALAGQLGSRPVDRFSWTHTYQALPWSRDGRQVLRVRAPRAGYWKGVSLDAFDGMRWRRATRLLPAADAAARSAHPGWVGEVSVDVRDMSSPQLYAPGDVLSISRTSVATQPDTPGTVRTSGRPMSRGDSYVARVYDPDPTTAQRRFAGVVYPAALRGAFTLGLPAPGGLSPAPGTRTPAVQVQFPPFGTPGPPLLVTPAGQPLGDASGLVRASVYSRAWTLARRLRAAAASPDDLVQRVQARLRAEATYDERPPASRVPLMAFLFGSRRGYCQHFSGAMALLLRMAGVPARVAEGFSPGTQDRAVGRYLVRDSDAHSWVEVFYPRIGWVVVDPTPSVAPPASQFDSAISSDAAPRGGLAPQPGAGDRPTGTAASRPAAGGSGGGGGPSGAVAVAAVVLAVLLMAAATGRRIHRHVWSGTPPELRELLRAFARAGVAVPAGATLITLQDSALAAAPEARAYLRAVARARYAVPGVAAAASPGRAARQGLRRALAAAAGGGTRGRLRAWWALPPGRPAWLPADRAARPRPRPGSGGSGG